MLVRRRSGLAALRAFWRDDAGASAVEYSLLATLIAVIFIASAAKFGVTLGNTYEHLAEHIGPVEP